jgi:hypothetical protein
MGLFKKKLDPVTERAKDLDGQIAALQAEIRKLSEQASAPPPSNPPGTGNHTSAPPAPSPPPTVAANLRPDPPSAIPKFNNDAKASPRLRSTALPHRPLNPPPTTARDPVFEEVNQPQIKADTEPPTPEPEELGTRKSDMASWWRRIMRHFRGPVTSNPKLVNYLAAGSIQGLQPLRYEKRVARNRFIMFALLLLLALWGLIVMLFSRR